MTLLYLEQPASKPALQLRRKLLAIVVAACFSSAQANPVSPQVVHGQATFNQQGSLFSIVNTPNTIIDWRSFSIAPGEITRFIQQSADSRVLNRILGQDPSQILGALQSNGKVFLINPNGVLFGPDARVDVQGLVASSLGLSNSDFLAGRNQFSAGATAGKVSNQGSLKTPAGGQIFLLAPSVENTGLITAPNGDVLLAAGQSVQLVDSGQPDVRVLVSAPSDAALNLGQVVAQGGRIGIYGALLSQRGTLNANSAVRGEQGQIILKASGTARVEAGSRTTASNSASGGHGGQIQLLGAQVAVTGDAVVDASGDGGGGSVLVGGDYQGKNAAVPNARRTEVGLGVQLRADAGSSGAGGKVVVWADESTRMAGSISARGGAAGGAGGQVETSGLYLDVAGARIDTSAAHGARGSWLLDPYDIEISSSGTAPLADGAAFNSGAQTGTSIINSATLSGASSDVVLQAKHDLTFIDNVAIAHAGTTLTAQAGNDIKVNANLSTNGGAIILLANAADSGSASGTGSVTLASGKTVSTGGGSLSLGGAGVTIDGAVLLGAGALDVRATVAGGAISLGSNASIIGDGSANLYSLLADNID
ncbi:MAG: filamentous hemagglutinin N-terminal domain-containing protein, partial [Sphingomonadaceae bacterium]